MLEIFCKNTKTNEVKPLSLKEADSALKNEDLYIWFDFWNMHETSLTQSEKDFLIQVLGIHPLNIDDLQVKKHPPKIEKNDGYFLMIFYEIDTDKQKNLAASDLGVIISDNYLVTYNNDTSKTIQNTKTKLLSSEGFAPDAVNLFYTIINQIINECGINIEKYDEKIEKIEEIIFKDYTTREILSQTNKTRMKISQIRSIIAAEKEIFNEIITNYDHILKMDNPVYFRDIYEHLDKIIIKLDTQKDEILGILNLQSALSNQKLNELIKFLTILSAILMPSTIIAGIFGMNFSRMPLIEYAHGFLLSILFMFLCAVASIAYFKHRKWL